MTNKYILKTFMTPTQIQAPLDIKLLGINAQQLQHGGCVLLGMSEQYAGDTQKVKFKR
jgi:hypothetical protein